MKTTVQTYKKKATKTASKVKDTVLDTATKGKNFVVKNPMSALYVVGGAVALYFIYKIATTTSNAIDNALEPDNIDTDVTGTGGSIKENELTITPFQASNFAQQLLDAMNVKQPFYGTDEATIEAVFDKIKTASDFLLVFKAFDLRDYNGNNSPPDSALWQWLDSYKPQNLVYWLKSELDPNDDKIIYNKVKNRVEPAGFTF